MCAKAHELDFSAVDAEEIAYLQGLYLADGCRYTSVGCRWGTTRYYVGFFLQGDQGAIVEKVVRILRRLGPTPYMAKPSRGEWMFDIRVASKSLYHFLPNKESLRENHEARERFFSRSGLLGARLGVPFLAGLLDGDGSLGVRINKTGSYFGTLVKWDWSLTQSEYKHAFLVHYVKRFVDSLMPIEKIGVTIGAVPSVGAVRAQIRKSGAITLLGAGLSEYSWKVANWAEKVAQQKSEREEYFTTGQLARILGVRRHAVLGWVKKGKLRQLRGTLKTRNSPNAQSRYYIPVEEVERFIKVFKEREEKVEKIKASGVSLLDASMMLGIPHTTLFRWYQHGKVQATLVHEPKGFRNTYLVVARGEIKRLRLAISGNRGSLMSRGAVNVAQKYTLIKEKAESEMAKSSRGPAHGHNRKAIVRKAKDTKKKVVPDQLASIRDID
ncbi:MAG: helix-turn-helix domain-containing protein [Promethearchaeati archaeon SRVP18_Atabeyarchaeia-1]